MSAAFPFSQGIREPRAIAGGHRSLTGTMMGIDASLFFHPGPALSLDELRAALRPVLDGRLGTTTVAAAQIADPLRVGVERAIHGLALFEAPDQRLRVSRGAIDEAARVAA